MQAKPLAQPGSQGGDRVGPPGGGDVVGVDRAFLRSTLVEGIEESTVFGAQVVGYTLHEDGVVARFADGTGGIYIIINCCARSPRTTNTPGSLVRVRGSCTGM